MAWGGVIWGADGRVQFDSTWPQMILVAKGRISATAQSVVVTGGRNPIAAFRPIACNAAIETEGKSGSTFTYNFKMYRQDSGGYIDYWIYDTVPPDPPSDGWGIVFQDEAGHATFSSLHTPMVMVAPDALPVSGRVYAIAPPVGPYWREQINVDFDSFDNPVIRRNTDFGGWIFDGTAFAIESMSWTSLGLSSDAAYDPSLSYYQILDVTNH